MNRAIMAITMEPVTVGTVSIEPVIEPRDQSVQTPIYTVEFVFVDIA